MVNSAVLMRQRGDVEGAMAQYNQVIGLSRTHNMPHMLNRTLLNLSVLHIAYDTFEQAEELLAEALALSQQVEDISSTAAIYYSMASTHLYQQRWTAAQQQLNKGQALVEALQDSELADQYRCLQLLLLALRGQWSEVPQLLGVALSRALHTGCVQDAFEALDVVVLYEVQRQRWGTLASLIPALATARRAQQYERSRFVERQIALVWERIPPELRAVSAEDAPQETVPVQHLAQTALLSFQRP